MSQNSDAKSPPREKLNQCDSVALSVAWESAFLESFLVAWKPLFENDS